MVIMGTVLHTTEPHQTSRPFHKPRHDHAKQHTTLINDQETSSGNTLTNNPLTLNNGRREPLTCRNTAKPPQKNGRVFYSQLAAEASHRPFLSPTRYFAGICGHFSSHCLHDHCLCIVCGSWARCSTLPCSGL